MSIKIGLYDFFSYTLPGFLYSTATLYFLAVINVIPSDVNIFLKIVKEQLILILICSYLLGLIFDPLSKPWYRLFAPKGLEKILLEQFKTRYKMKVKFEPIDWTILLAFIRRNNMELAAEIEKQSVTKVMLRNVSFSLLIIAMITLILFFKSNFHYLDLVLSIVFIILSIVSNREAAKFDNWFFQMIYQTAAAYNLEAKDFTALPSGENQKPKNKSNVEEKKNSG